MFITNISLQQHTCQNEVNKQQYRVFNPGFTSYCSAVSETSASLGYSELISKSRTLFQIFKNDPKIAPKGLILKISPVSEKIIGFSKELMNGNQLEVYKTVFHKGCKDVPLLNMKESKNGKTVHALAIDMNSNDLYRLLSSRKNGKTALSPYIVEQNNVHYSKLCERFKSYFGEIYSCRNKQNTETTANSYSVFKPGIKKSAKPANKITLEDLLDEQVLLETPKAITKEEFLKTENKAAEPAIGRDLVLKNKTDKKIPVLKNNTVLPAKNIQKPEFFAKNQPEIFSQEKFLPENKFDEEGAAKANIAPDIIKVRTTRPVADGETGYLSRELASDIGEIENLLFRISKLADNHRGSFGKLAELKSNYKPLLYTPLLKKKVTVFKLTDNASIGVIHTQQSGRFTRFIYTDCNGKETHLLVDGRQKIAANLNEKTPWIVPVKYRYMTKSQVESSHIDAYVPFLKKELEKYYNYLSASL